MKRTVLTGLIALLVLGACGRKGPPVRESGTEPPVVATTVIQNATTEPTKPRGTLF